MAHSLGVLIGDYLAGTTHRQHLTWVEWLEAQWNRPDRTDHYLMQVAAEVTAGRVKRPGEIKMSRYVLKFKSRQEARAESEAERKARVDRSKAFWFGGVGLKPDGTVDPERMAEIRRQNQSRKRAAGERRGDEARYPKGVAPRRKRRGERGG